MYHIISNKSLSKSLVWECYGAFYLTFYIALISEYKFYYLGHCILKRLEQLNKHLEIINNFKNEGIEKIIFKNNIITCLPRKVCEGNTENSHKINELTLSKLNCE